MLVISLFNFLSVQTHAAGLLTLSHFSHEAGTESFQDNDTRDEEVWTFDPSQADGSEITGPLVNDDVLNCTADDIDAFLFPEGNIISQLKMAPM